MKRSGSFGRAGERPRRSSRSPLSRWLADAAAIQLLRPSPAAERIRNQHLVRLTAELIDGEEDVEVLRDARVLLAEVRPAADSSPRSGGGDPHGFGPDDLVARIDARLCALERAAASPQPRTNTYLLGSGASATPTAAAPRWRPPRGWPHAPNPFWCPPRRTRREAGGGGAG